MNKAQRITKEIERLQEEFKTLQKERREYIEKNAFIQIGDHKIKIGADIFYLETGRWEDSGHNCDFVYGEPELYLKSPCGTFHYRAYGEAMSYLQSKFMDDYGDSLPAYVKRVKQKDSQKVVAEFRNVSAPPCWRNFQK